MWNNPTQRGVSSKMKKDIYKITVKNWSTHNKAHKKSFKKTLISNNFCSDNKLGVLPLSHRWLFLGLLLECGSHNTDTVELNEKQLRALLESSKSIDRALDALQSLQLVSYEKYSLFMNRIEVNRREVKGREIPTTSENEQKTKKKIERVSAQQPLAVSPPKSSEVWKAYCEAYESRYRVTPSDNRTIRAQMCKLVDLVGKDDAVEIVKFYLTHNDSFYLRATHSFGLCLRDASSLRTQWLKGRAITQNDIRQFEKKLETSNLLKSIQAEGV
jgi:hypothetical protein